MDPRPGNDTTQGKRDEQQDAFGFSSFQDTALRSHGGVLAVLADGMGGMSNGRAASQTAVDHMLAAYARKEPRESIPQALMRSLGDANAAVYALAASREGEGEVGTTLVACVVHQGEAYWLSVGDSRLYLYQAANDTLTACTLDHTRTNQLLARVARGELTRAEAEADPDGPALVSFLGLREIPDIDRSLRPRRLAPGDRLLLVSDGVYNTLAERDIALLLRNDAQAAAEALIKAVVQRDAPNQDNATAVVLALGELTQAASPPPAKTLHAAGAPAAAAPTGAAARAAKAPKRSSPLKPLALGAGALLLLAVGVGIGVLVGPLVPRPETPETPETPVMAAEPPPPPAADDPLQPNQNRETFPGQTPVPAAAEAGAPEATPGAGGESPETNAAQPPEGAADTDVPAAPSAPAEQTDQPTADTAPETSGSATPDQPAPSDASAAPAAAPATGQQPPAAQPAETPTPAPAAAEPAPAPAMDSPAATPQQPQPQQPAPTPTAPPAAPQQQAPTGDGSGAEDGDQPGWMRRHFGGFFDPANRGPSAFRPQEP
jgi:PPM family protein phosphatase